MTNDKLFNSYYNDVQLDALDYLAYSQRHGVRQSSWWNCSFVLARKQRHWRSRRSYL